MNLKKTSALFLKYIDLDSMINDHLRKHIAE